MGKSYWYLVGGGAVGGATIVASAIALYFLESPFNYVMFLIMLLVGASVIYYARYG